MFHFNLYTLTFPLLILFIVHMCDPCYNLSGVVVDDAMFAEDELFDDNNLEFAAENIEYKSRSNMRL
ncbi:hypothetical protein QVD17_28708 [Tagetes erecta]|uniref:Uncharacterized protein n=1 Tax=Tagetes erecta TaxID=13708 RepID=A0AAD8KB44_TARER|nr:hypothetical protein QVD17_28708 [Tagetes erecta]